MPSLKSILEQKLKECLEKMVPDQNLSFELNRPANPKFGDFATNAALMLSHRLKKNPREVASHIVKAFEDDEDFLDKIEIAGPGFINFTIKPTQWILGMSAILQQASSFGVCKANVGKKALIEFVSANPTGPLHVGHGRNAVVGDGVANLLRASGYVVEKEYYVNDGGIQIQTLGESVFVRLKELQGEKIPFPENGYQGEYLIDMAKTLLDRSQEFFGLPKDQAIQKLGRFAGDQILNEIKEDLKRLGITFDRTFFESTLYGRGLVKEAFAKLKTKDLIYEKEGATWLGSMKLGDDKDRVLIKSDGSYTYLAPDIAYHLEKYARGYDLMVNIWGADHAGYVPRLKAALSGLRLDPKKLEVLLIQMVNLVRGGELVSMSTRKAQYQTLESVTVEVGKDVARYFFMMRSYQAQLDFDVELARKQSHENPVFYIQYAHARICSVFEKAGEGPPSFEEKFCSLLKLPEEIDLAKFLLSYPELVEKSAAELAPHRIAFYVLELARHFQAYYDKARSDERYRVVTANVESTRAKLFLIACVRQVLRNALGILGVSAPEKM